MKISWSRPGAAIATRSASSSNAIIAPPSGSVGTPLAEVLDRKKR